MSSLTKVKWHPGRALAAADRACDEGARLAAEDALARANMHVPLMSGRLRDTGRVSVDAHSGTAVVSYDTVYAARLHSHPEYDFQNGREAGWLWKAIEDTNEIESSMAKGARAEFR